MAAPHDSRKQQTQAFFDRLAPEYDRVGPGCFAYFGQRLVAAAAVAPGQQILDVATGRGAVLLPAAEITGPTGTALGIDLSGEMVRLTNAAITQRGLHASAQVMDAETLAFPAATFDRVLCGFGVMFLPNLEQALGDFLRVLKPQGRLALSTWQTAQAADLHTVLVRLALLPPETPDPALAYNTPETVDLPLARAGFGVRQVTSVTTTFHYHTVEEYWQMAHGTGLRRWLAPLSAQAQAQVRDALREQLRPYQQDDGYHLPSSALFAVASAA